MTPDRGSGSPEETLLHVRVTPRGGRDEVIGWKGGCLCVRVSAAPEGGAANRAVIALVAERFGAPKSAVEIVRGAGGRDKWLRVGDLSVSALRAMRAEED